MTEQPQQSPDDEPLDPTAQPAAGGTDEGEPAQGEGEQDSY